MPDLPPLAVEGARLSPTDISQFIRLEQCERYLRLRLHERANGRRFLYDYGVAPQSIAPLLTRSGRLFEEEVEVAVSVLLPSVRCAAPAGGAGDRPDDNDRLLEQARSLPPGGAVVLFQPRLRAELDGWHLTGDADVVRLERGADGCLDVLIVDVKSSAAPRVEHRLQVAFYHAALAKLLEGAGPVGIRTGILYRTPLAGAPAGEEAGARRDAARALLGVEDALLEVVEDPDAYLQSVADLVTGPEALARRVAGAPFEEIPFHLTFKCDGCLYNEFCMKWAAERDDLSLLPHLTGGEKNALRRAGVRSMGELAGVKQPPAGDVDAGPPAELEAAPGREELAARLSTTWPVGPRIDELVHRARRYRQWKGDPVRAPSYIPSKGYGSLPYSDAEHNPNLVRVYIDAQHDYLNDRVYLLGALVVACEEGVPARRRSIVHLAEAPVRTGEQEERLLARWVNDTLRAIVELAAPDGEGEARAPLHVVFFNSFEQRLLLDGLSRNFGPVLASAPALYDFMTQLAAFDSPIATFLDEEIRELRNYPMVCQSLASVARFLRFDWDTPQPFSELFRTRVFDDRRALETDGEPDWYTGRARFSSQIPLEYAYAAWGELERPQGSPDDFAAYRAATPELLGAFQARRLDALEHVARDFRGNHLTEKRPFDLPELSRFTDTARSLAQALQEFITIERHVELNAWKTVRHAPPERRVLMGETLVVRYLEADQDPGAAERNRENERRRLLTERYRDDFRAANPGAARVTLTSDQREECRWSQEGLRLRLRLETAGLDCDLESALALSTLREGSRLVVNRRWTTDSRLPADQQVRFTPTPKQMLYGTRADLARLHVERDGDGRPRAAWAEISLAGTQGRATIPGFVFTGFEYPLLDGEVYTLDSCPNDWYGYWCAKTVEGLRAAEEGPGPVNTLYDRVNRPGAAAVDWPAAAGRGQERFLGGLDALRAAGALHDFEESKRQYIGGCGSAPVLLVQGPPGTGKSYSTGFALFARLQGAMAAGRDFRVLVSCKTHAATDVLIENVRAAQEKLRELKRRHQSIFSEHFDERILDVPLFRIASREPLHPDVRLLPKEAERQKGQPKSVDALLAERWCVAAAAPGGIYNAVKAKWPELHGPPFCDCLVLDEASQMNLAEAVMAALPLRPEAQLIVVGDHRQMPPVVQHDWESEPRRTFQEYRAYESLFLTLLPLASATIRFAESFRLHADMAEFLRREIYSKDGIPYHSRRRDVLAEMRHEDGFLAAVLAPAHPLVVVVHDEEESQTSNPFERGLLGPVLAVLADPERYGLDSEAGLGVVVPHRAQRAALQLAFPYLAVGDAEGGPTRSAVDTVERFQGGERRVIIVSATESDREYLLASSKFLLDPRRLTVAVSRAKQKLVLVASRSVFSLFSADEETFARARLWKDLLRRTCTEPLWSGERNGRGVQVWGNRPAA